VEVADWEVQSKVEQTTQPEKEEEEERAMGDLATHPAKTPREALVEMGEGERAIFSCSYLKKTPIRKAHKITTQTSLEKRIIHHLYKTRA